jgi:hypothetical protein
VRPDGCHEWTGARRRQGGGAGYGCVGYNGKRIAAHVAFYLEFVGPIPPGHDVDHKCHRESPDCPGGPECMHRPCVNVEHLRAIPLRLNRGYSLRHLTQEQANAIRADPRVSSVVAAEWGVNRGTVWRIQRGLVYKEVAGADAL